MKHLITILVSALVLTACNGENPNPVGSSPVTQEAPSQPPVEPVGVIPEPMGDTPVSNEVRVASGPRGIPGDCLHAVYMPDTVEWVIENVPLDAHVEKGYGHGSTAKCAPTVDNLRTQNDHLRWVRDVQVPTTIRVSFDLNTYGCGHTQIDISVNGVNVLGEVIKYRYDCQPTDNVCKAQTAVEWFSVFRVGNEVEAYFWPRPESVGQRVYLSSYKKPTPPALFPQTRSYESSHVMTAGENRFRVKLAEGQSGRQADFACVPGPKTLVESFYTADNLIGWYED